MDRLGSRKGIGRYLRVLFQKNMLIFFSITLLLNSFSTAVGSPMGKAKAEGNETITEVTDAAELNDIRNDLDGHYELSAHIDVTDIADWKPIGDEEQPFNGTFKGNGFTIKGMDYEFEETEYEGLFGIVSNDAIVEDIVVEFKVVNTTEETSEVTNTEEANEAQTADTKGTKEANEAQTDTEGTEETETIEEETPASFNLLGAQTTEEVEFAGGNGTKNDPYIIENADQLNEIREGLNKHYKLNANINLNVSPYNEGAGWEPIGKNLNTFQGTFDGNGFKISGLMINRPTSNLVGLFGYVSTTNSKIENVTLEQVDIEGKDEVGGLVGKSSYVNINNSKVSGRVTGENYVGGLVGYLVNGKHSYNETNVKVTGSDRIGGLIGKLYEGQILNSFSIGDVQGTSHVGGLIGASETSRSVIKHSFATGNVVGSRDRIGGLIGWNESGTIEETYAHGDVIGQDDVGGLIGRSGKYLKDSYAVGLVTSDGSNVGGLIGIGQQPTNGFYDMNTTNQSDTGKGEPKSTADMQKQSTFTGWDFTNTWIIAGQNEYPRFLKEGEQGSASDIIFVKENSNGDGTSWDNAFGTLQEALDKSVSGNDIWIAAGTYVPTGNISYANEIYDNPRTAHFKLKNRVGIYGGFPASGDPSMDERDPNQFETILSGDLEGNDIPGDFDTNRDDNVYTVIINDDQLDAGTVLDGVTISGGHSMHHLNLNGGGIRINNAHTYLTLRNLIVKDNYAKLHGGGLSISHAKVTLENATITKNKANGTTLLAQQGYGGGVYVKQGTLLAENVKVNDNNASVGGGVSNNDGHVQFINSEIRGNEASTNGGGIYATHGSDSTFINVLISGNTVGSAGAGFHATAGTPQRDKNITFINSTISNNWTTNHDRGGAMSIGARNEVVIKNSIVWGNYYKVGNQFKRNTFHGSAPRKITAYHSIIEDISKKDENPEWISMDQGGNMDTDPGFIDIGPSSMPTMGGDYRLTHLSPAINMGDNSFIAGHTRDLSGKSRIVDGVVDMGAYEHRDPGAISKTLQLDGVAVPVTAGTIITIGGTNASIQLPNDLPDGTKLEVKSVEPNAPGLTQSGEVFDFIFTFPNGKGFDDITGDFILTLGVNDDADTEKASIYHYNEEDEKWELVGGDVEDGKITIAVEEFSQYGVFTANGNIIYVKEDGAGNEDGTSWEHAFATLQKGLEAATTEGDQIWIAAGTYFPTKDASGNDSPTNERLKTFQMKNNLAIYGGFKGDDNNETVASRDFLANETILSGDLGTTGDNSDNAYHVFYHSDSLNLDSSAVLDGVTITEGNANASSISHASRGGGMYNENSNPTLINVTITENTASNGGGMYNQESNPTLIKVDIIKSRASHGAGIMNVTSNPTLNDVTINQNEASGDNGGGGGMMNLDDSHPTLTNVEITDNKANGQYGAGGGIYNENSKMRLTEVVIAGNDATTNGGGVYNAKSSYIEMSGGEITENTSYYGGGMHNENSSPRLTDVLISNNIASDNGGGMANLNESSPILTNVQILGNTGDDGGGMANESNSNPTIINTLISDNKSLDSGSGVFNNESNPTFINVTISNNIGEHGSEGMYNFGANPIIQNSIIWGHDESIVNEDGSTPLIRHSLIEGSGGSVNWGSSLGTDEGNNLDVDPKFVDAVSGDYRLLAGSLAIDAGNNAFVPADVKTDLAGNMRVLNIVDMGAYEHESTPSPVPGGDITVIYVDEDNNEIASRETLSGNVGDAYTTDQKAITGYTFKKVNGDASGTFTADSQEVTFVYTKDPVIEDKKINAPNYDSIHLKTGWYDLDDLPLYDKIEVTLDDGSKVELKVT